jgi:hypothetical protein
MVAYPRLVLVPVSIDAIRTAVRRTAAVGRVVVGRPSGDPFRSCLGRVSVIGRDEAWPTYDSRPMASLAQVNLTEALFKPPALAGSALIACWIAEEGGIPVSPDDRPNGDGWAVRAYGALDELRLVDGQVLEGVRPRQLDWDLVEDYPDWEDLVEAVDLDRLERLLEGREAADVIGSATSGMKLGGWPTLIQSEIFWGRINQHPATPDYCFQLDSEESVGLNLWDSGIIHVGVGTVAGERVWVAESQSL